MSPIRSGPWMAKTTNISHRCMDGESSIYMYLRVPKWPAVPSVELGQSRENAEREGKSVEKFCCNFGSIDGLARKSCWSWYGTRPSKRMKIVVSIVRIPAAVTLIEHVRSETFRMKYFHDGPNSSPCNCAFDVSQHSTPPKSRWHFQIASNYDLCQIVHLGELPRTIKLLIEIAPPGSIVGLKIDSWNN
jgi:hypothetical protein